MKKIFKLAIIIFPILLFFSCAEDEDVLLTYNSDIISIEHGTSFGECLGYCIRSIEITGMDVEFDASGMTVTDKLPDINISGEITIEDWENLVNKIDFVVFRNLEEVMGCPDCNDGGAEWIEITTSELSHKVTFEYYNEPEEVQNYIDDLRNLMEQYEERIN